MSERIAVKHRRQSYNSSYCTPVTFLNHQIQRSRFSRIPILHLIPPHEYPFLLIRIFIFPFHFSTFQSMGPPTTIRKAIGAVKDQTTIGIVKVGSNVAPELKVAVVKATSHDDDPAAAEKYVGEILRLTSRSRVYVAACVSSISKRLCKTRDWIVALKCLMLVHRLLNEGDPNFRQEIRVPTRIGGTRLLNLSGFRDEAHSNSSDHSAFVRVYALYLDQKLELMIYNGVNVGEKFEKFGGIREEKDEITPLGEMHHDRIFGRMTRLRRLLDRLVSCRPTGSAKNERMILVAVRVIVKESFRVYADVCEVLAVILDRFFDMEYRDCVKAFDAYATSAKHIDELIRFYNWCKDIGVARSSEYPGVQRITGELLDTLEEFVREKSSDRKLETVGERSPNVNEIKALPPPEKNHTPSAEPLKPFQEISDLLDLRDEGVTPDDQGDKLALALFTGPAPNDEDPFAASLSVPPPAYVQMADMERKRRLLVQENMAWERYTGTG